MSADIDFVVTWVDPSDPAWQAQKDAFSSEDHADGSLEFRFRDWGSLRYWFRSVEVNAPWVRKIHFVTCGQIPEWLNTDCPKLNLVNHEDFIPKEYLPTFNVNPVELNFHRIEGLAEQFVYFNDDMFVGAKAAPELFFKDGLPVDLAALNVFCYTLDDPTQLCVVRDTGVINKHFDIKTSLAQYRGKWITPKAGKYLPRTFVLRQSPRFPGFVIHHCALPLLKSTFEELWRVEPDLLDEVCRNRFRSITDLNIWLMKEWQLASGTFSPASARNYRYLSLDSIDAARSAAQIIGKRDVPHICLNDSPYLSHEDFLEAAPIVNAAFAETYNEPSMFEKR